MQTHPVLVCFCFFLLSMPWLHGQENGPSAPAHRLLACDDSPAPGVKPPNMRCATLVHTRFSSLPEAPIVLRVETFPSTAVARQSASAASAVVEARGKVWLLTLASKGKRSSSGHFVTEIGPIPDIGPAPEYELVVSEADFSPAMNPAVSNAVHTHSGPEIWYVFTGEQCLETPGGIQRAKAGEGMFAPAETPMQLNITGTSSRDALFAIVHDARKPATTASEWAPKLDCQK